MSDDLEDERPIERVREVVAYSAPDNPWVKLYFDEVRFPDGALGRYNRIAVPGGVAGVAILPIRGEEIGLRRQFRYAIGEALLEIPRGFGETGNPEEDAARELAEETGITDAAMTRLGSIHPDSGLVAGEVVLFAAAVDREEAGDGRISWFPRSEVTLLVASGNISDPYLLACLAIETARGGL